MSLDYSKHPACLTLQVIPLHMLVLPTSALTGTSSSPVTTSMRPLSHMCGAWMEYQWNMMEKSLLSTMVMDLSLSWMSVKIDMLGEKLCSNVVWTWLVGYKFVENTTPLIPSVSNMQLQTACIVGLVAASFNYIFVNFSLITEQPEAPTVRTVRTEQTSISLSWEVCKTCFESVDFTVNISWRSASGNGEVRNVSGNSYDITGLTPNVSYDITLVAIGDGIQSDPISISCSTKPSGETTVHVVLQWRAGLISSRKGCRFGCWCIRCTSRCGILSLQ